MALSNPMNVNVLSGGTGKHTYDVADQFIPEIWGMAVEDLFRQKIVMDNVATDLSPNVANEGDVIHLPHFGTPSLTAFTQGSEIEVDQTGSDTDQETTLTIDQYNVASVYVPDIVQVQGSYDLVSIYAKQLAYAVARGFDNFMHYQVANNFQGLLSSATGAEGADPNNSMHIETTGSVLSQGNLTSLMALILAETGSTEGWNLMLSPKMYSSLNALTEYAQGTQAPLGAGFGKTGNAGQLLGMPVWVTQSPYMVDGADVSANTAKGILEVDDLETSGTNNNDIVYGYAIHDSALYYAFSKRAKITASYRHAYLSTLVTCESVYGGAIRNTDADGNRRAFALIDHEA